MRPNPSHPSQAEWFSRSCRKAASELTISDLPDMSNSYRSAAEAVWHAIVLVEVILSSARKGRLPIEKILVLRRDAPYFIHDTAYPRTQILLNRNYKPVGSNLPDCDTWVDYEDYPQAHVQLTADDIAKVVAPPYDRGLFGDGCQPWRSRGDTQAYLERLRLLHRLLVRFPVERGRVEATTG